MQYILIPSFVLAIGMSINPDFPVNIGSTVSSSPIIDDIDNNGFRDIIIPSWDNKIHLLLQDRTGFHETVYDSLDIALSGENLTPAIIPIDSNNKKIVWTTDEGVLYCFSYKEPPASGSKFLLSGNIPKSSPSCYEDDKYIYIVQAQPDKGIILIDPISNETKEIGIGSTVLTDPSISDIDNDMIPDVVFGTKDGIIYAFSTDDLVKPKWTYRTSSEFIGGTCLADIDRDNKFEVFLCSIDGTLYGIDDDGVQLAGFPIDVSDGQVTHGVVTTPAISDMNGDGEYEICITTGIQQSQSGSLKLYNKIGTEIGSWTSKNGGIISSPIFANIDNDVELEVFAISYNGEMVALNYDGTVVDGFPRNAPGGTYSSTPAYSDLDNDDYGEFVIVNENGELYLYDLDTIYIFSPWSMYGGAPKRSGLSSIYERESPKLTLVQIEGYVNLKWKAIAGIETWVILKKVGSESEFKKVCELASSRNSFKDRITSQCGSITYRLEGKVNQNTIISSEAVINIESYVSPIPKSSITNTYPNPFSDKITISFNIEGKSQSIRLAIYDVSGKLICLLKQEIAPIGEHIATWDGMSQTGESVSTGVYFCRLESESGTSTRSIILLR
ncbi:MAG: T9SS type A sorting domain-containing protein [bacterium]